MKIISDDKIKIDHIIWQPRAECMNRCHGCYLRDSKVSQYKEKLNDEILDLIFESGRVKCDFLTICLNSTVKSDPELGLALSKTWEKYRKKEKELPELCLLTTDRNSLTKWSQISQLSPDTFLKPIFMVSLSRFPVLGKHCEELVELSNQTDTILNFNTLATRNITESKQFQLGCRYSDQIYLVLFKGPLGKKPPSEAIRWYKQAKQYIIDNKLGYKLEEDKCLLSMESHQICNGGTQKIMVWPSGYTSGCPYDTNQLKSEADLTKRHKTWREIQTAISKEYSPTEHCNIL